MNWIAILPPPPHDLLPDAIGVAAVVFAAGWAITRWQRDRLRFALMKTALEKGVTRFPGTPPYWLVSLRLGVTLVALGTGVAIVGGGAWLLAPNVAMPTASLAAQTQTTAPAAAAQPTQPPPPLEERPDERPGPEGHPPRPEPEESLPPDERGSHHHFDGPPDRREGPEGEDRPPREQPPHHDPQEQLWHEAHAQKTIGLASVGVGFILMLLGIVRIGFAKIEQRYVTDGEEAVM